MEYKQTFLDSFFARIRDQLSDLSSLEVITATGDPGLKIDSEKANVLDSTAALQILARTTIKINGDIVTILPTSKVDGEFKINKDIIDIHRQNMDAAVQNWRGFVDTLLNVTGYVSKIAGLGDVDIREKLGLTSIMPKDR